jgi:hypothetical protein
MGDVGWLVAGRSFELGKKCVSVGSWEMKGQGYG